VRSASIVFVSAVALALACPALGKDKDKDDKPGHGRGGPPDRAAAPPGRAVAPAAPVTVVVPERDRRTVYGYYRTEYIAGNCPPGLAKKNNGCLPPGQAKKIWVVGQPLPPAIVYYPLPPTLVTQLSPPPPGYDYVQVDNDVVLMELGNRMIIDIVADLSSFD
jgi:hypothetical protein